jgi:hypothetical protein
MVTFHIFASSSGTTDSTVDAIAARCHVGFGSARKG